MTRMYHPIATRIPELTINWHILEPCNFTCSFCYAKYECKESLFKQQYKKLIPELRQLKGQVLETASGPILADGLRLNFAGGEPMLVGEYLFDAIDLAHCNGMRPSIITNGIRVTDDFIREYGPKLSVFGVSVDSFDREVNERIGRQERNPKDGVESQLTFERLSRIFGLFREVSPGTKLKINTVACPENINENLREQFLELGPDRLKILRVIPIFGAEGCGITDQQYKSFIHRHREVPFEFITEDNHEMHLSYLRLNPQGCFDQRFEEIGKECYTSRPVVEVGAREALREIRFDAKTYLSRY